MIKKLIARTDIEAGGTAQKVDGTRFDRMKAAYEEWRIAQDIGAVMSALGRLSDKRLEMIGLRRDGLYDAVTERMELVQQQKRIGEEVLALLDKEPEAGEQPRISEPRTDPAQPASEIAGRAAA